MEALQEETKLKRLWKVCDNCTQRVITNFKTSVVSYPEVMTFCLKRLFRSRHLMPNLKVPHELMLGEYKYKLKSTVIHEGTLEGGHYYAVAKYEEHFYKLNDNFVKEIPCGSVENMMRGAYVLIFEKVDEENTDEGNFQ